METGQIGGDDQTLRGLGAQAADGIALKEVIGIKGLEAAEDILEQLLVENGAGQGAASASQGGGLNPAEGDAPVAHVVVYLGQGSLYIF
jgi:hypothetical protein